LLAALWTNHFVFLVRIDLYQDLVPAVADKSNFVLA